MVGDVRQGNRRVVIGVQGLWRWAFRGGSSEQAYRALFAGTVDWLLALPEANGMTLEVLGTPYRSGNYPGVFVPYRLRFANGSEKRGNLALRTDLNPQGRWLCDGGI